PAVSQEHGALRAVGVAGRVDLFLSDRREDGVGAHRPHGGRQRHPWPLRAAARRSIVPGRRPFPESGAGSTGLTHERLIMAKSSKPQTPSKPAGDPASTPGAGGQPAPAPDAVASAVATGQDALAAAYQEMRTALQATQTALTNAMSQADRKSVV